jgi:hypothetical protein
MPDDSSAKHRPRRLRPKFTTQISRYATTELGDFFNDAGRAIASASMVSKFQ